MATITEVEKLAFELPASDRAVLAAHLLRSLPSVLHDEDEGIAEVRRRVAEVESGRVRLIHGDEALARVRQLVASARASR